MTNKNVRIAKELVRIAKDLVADSNRHSVRTAAARARYAKGLLELFVKKTGLDKETLTTKFVSEINKVKGGLKTVFDEASKDYKKNPKKFETKYYGPDTLFCGTDFFIKVSETTEISFDIDINETVENGCKGSFVIYVEKFFDNSFSGTMKYMFSDLLDLFAKKEWKETFVINNCDLSSNTGDEFSEEICSKLSSFADGVFDKICAAEKKAAANAANDAVPEENADEE